MSNRRTRKGDGLVAVGLVKKSQKHRRGQAGRRRRRSFASGAVPTQRSRRLVSSIDCQKGFIGGIETPALDRIAQRISQSRAAGSRAAGMAGRRYSLLAPIEHGSLPDPSHGTASRRPRPHYKLTMPATATSENIAPRHCSDERGVNSQKPERGAGGVAKF